MFWNTWRTFALVRARARLCVCVCSMDGWMDAAGSESIKKDNDWYSFSGKRRRHSHTYSTTRHSGIMVTMMIITVKRGEWTASSYTERQHRPVPSVKSSDVAVRGDRRDEEIWCWASVRAAALYRSSIFGVLLNGENNIELFEQLPAKPALLNQAFYCCCCVYVCECVWSTYVCCQIK